MIKAFISEKQSGRDREENGKMQASQTTGRWNRMRVSREVKMESRKARLTHSSADPEEARVASEAVSGH